MDISVLLTNLAGALVILLAIGWWGSQQIFYPSRMIPLTIYPKQFELEYTKASFRTSDGLLLQGWLIPAKQQTNKTIFACHGWGDNKGDLLMRIHFLCDHYNMFLFDTRAHGNSEGTLTSVGAIESRDFEAALNFLKKEKPTWTEELGFFGLSMGAAMGIYGMGVHPDFKCAVLESPYESFNAVVTQFTTNHYKIPYFPIVPVILGITRFRLGLDPEPYSPAHHIHKLAVPLFFLVGSDDRLMPLKQVQAIYDAATAPKELWIVPEAQHGKCHEIGESYRKRIMEFFQKHL